MVDFESMRPTMLAKQNVRTHRVGGWGGGGGGGGEGFGGGGEGQSGYAPTGYATGRTRRGHLPTSFGLHASPTMPSISVFSLVKSILVK